jgi:hypothetical protein
MVTRAADGMKLDRSPISKERRRKGRRPDKEDTTFVSSAVNRWRQLRAARRPHPHELEFNGVDPGMGHGEAAGFEASVALNRKDFGIDIYLPLKPAVRSSATR